MFEKAYTAYAYAYAYACSHVCTFPCSKYLQKTMQKFIMKYTVNTSEHNLSELSRCSAIMICCNYIYARISRLKVI